MSGAGAVHLGTGPAAYPSVVPPPGRVGLVEPATRWVVSLAEPVRRPGDEEPGRHHQVITGR